MNSTKKQARVAGLLYLLASVPAFVAWVYVPNKLIATRDATATANRVRASETLFRLSIGSELIGLIVFIFVVLALYQLFKPVSEKHALAMATLLLISNPFAARLLPAHRQVVAQFADILQMAELPIIFWLLIWGAKDKPLNEQSALPSHS